MRERLSSTFVRFFEAEQASGVLLLACTALAILIANSPLRDAYHHLLAAPVAGLTIELWVNDALMAIFFLLIGLELERELYSGELADLRKALLPLMAAIGGMVVPAAIHFALNRGSPTVVGTGIPMATDIAFALGVLAALRSRIPAALKVFVVAFAVIDDLGAIVVIALFYTTGVYAAYLTGAFAVFVLLVFLNRYARVMALTPYVVGGALMWWLLLRSGVHATLAGVALAFAIPYSSRDSDSTSPSHRLEHLLHRPVAFLIVPVFALANTGVHVESGWLAGLVSTNSSGIIFGLVVGKPLGVAVFAWGAVASGLCRLPTDVGWRHIAGAGMLGGIGFTMSIFITNLAYAGDDVTANASKIAILVASIVAGAAGYLWLRYVGRPDAAAA